MPCRGCDFSYSYTLGWSGDDGQTPCHAQGFPPWDTRIGAGQRADTSEAARFFSKYLLLSGLEEPKLAPLVSHLAGLSEALTCLAMTTSRRAIVVVEVYGLQPRMSIPRNNLRVVEPLGHRERFPMGGGATPVFVG